VLKGKDIKFSTRNEVAFFINLFHLGVSHNINLDGLFIHTLIVQVNLEGNSGLSSVVTSKVLELLGIRCSRALLWHEI
jgi:hypothetical protein